MGRLAILVLVCVAVVQGTPDGVYQAGQNAFGRSETILKYPRVGPIVAGDEKIEGYGARFVESPTAADGRFFAGALGPVGAAPPPSKPLPPPRVPEVPMEEFDCHRKEDGSYPAGLCAKHYFKCEDNKEERIECEFSNERFSPEVGMCLEKMSVPGCRHMQRMLNKTHPCSQDGPSLPNGFYPDPEGDCNKYVFCAGGNLYSVNCREGEVYDDGRGRCFKPDEVIGYCGTKKPDVFSCVDRDDGYYRSREDCAVYYMCKQHSITAMTCPFFQAFDFHTKSCIADYKVEGCSLPKDLSRGQRFCQTIDRDDVYPNPTDCSSSIVCTRGNAYLYECVQPGLRAYDPEERACVPHYKGCGILQVIQPTVVVRPGITRSVYVANERSERVRASYGREDVGVYGSRREYASYERSSSSSSVVVYVEGPAVDVGRTERVHDVNLHAHGNVVHSHPHGATPHRHDSLHGKYTYLGERDVTLRVRLHKDIVQLPSDVYVFHPEATPTRYITTKVEEPEEPVKVVTTKVVREPSKVTTTRVVQQRPRVSVAKYRRAGLSAYYRSGGVLRARNASGGSIVAKQATAGDIRLSKGQYSYVALN